MAIPHLGSFAPLQTGAILVPAKFYRIPVFRDLARIVKKRGCAMRISQRHAAIMPQPPETQPIFTQREEDVRRSFAQKT
jgi:hypothetical protein